MTATAEALVVGLGAMGSATAWQLARRGVEVIGLDRHAPPHLLGSSGGETRVTREFVGEGEAYVPLVRRSHAIWRELEAREGELFARVGCLLMAQAGQEAPRHGQRNFFERTLQVARAYGQEPSLLDATEIRARYPQFKATDRTIGYLDEAGGFVRPERCIAAQLAAAEREGGRLRFGEAVLDIARDGRGVAVTTDRERYLADQVVVTAGAWTPALLGGRFASGLRVLPQVQYWFAPSEPELWRQDRCPVYLWFHGEGPEDFFYGMPLVDGGVAGVKVATEQYGQASGPDELERSLAPDEGGALAARMYREHVAPCLEGVTPRAVEVMRCLYTFNPGPPDGRFLIGPHPDIEGVTVVSACSGHGFKHSAGLGEALAQRLVEGSSACDLSVFVMS